ncbi:glycosyltransferase [Neobacillus niacini]|uniref:glycosyltransferase n=1 Tax=Neobacillus niacini TaxID=86668 RepID=UPI0021CB3628|nr:glycosyltransferase [Neobacillus niacini]MCM3763503.1 glycosyltransferase [Neobacillus niacini]
MKITLVIVVYKTLIDQSTTIRSLLNAMNEDSASFKNISIVIYDNSPEKQVIDLADFKGIEVIYQHDSRNLGIAAAYNFAWSQAKENGSGWLLLLDHDTNLTGNFIEQALDLPELPKDIVAVVPEIHSANTMISPVFSHSLRPLQMERPKPGVQEQPVMAINSGTLLRIEFLNEIGGFNEEFPLDYLDHWLFYEIYAKGKKVFLMDTTLEHDLSVMDYSKVSLNRYKSIINSEVKFYKNYKKDLFPAYKKQLMKRFLKQALIVKNKHIAMYTLRKLFSI